MIWLMGQPWPVSINITIITTTTTTTTSTTTTTTTTVYICVEASRKFLWEKMCEQFSHGNDCAQTSHVMSEWKLLRMQAISI